VPGLLDAGATVAIGSDGTAPDRSYDMFRHMWQAMHYHRTHHKDPALLPPGKALEMVTCDAARCLGTESLVGSLEAGKAADVILVDLRRPHLYPQNMPLFRLVCFAAAADVSTVIVGGRVLMQNRVVAHVDEGAVLDRAAREAALAVERAGLGAMLETPKGFWRSTRYAG
jgi:cytosine/adenosine deaminase-related metal-dependent hydrolase